MIPIFESILPIFLLVVLGVVLKRAPIVDRSVWHGLEEVGYYVLIPAIVFLTLLRADFGGFEITEVAAGCLLTVAISFIALIAAWPIFKSRGVTEAEFTTVIQTTTRWNGFIALAITDRLFGANGLALTALIMAIVLIPINLGNVSIMGWFLNSEQSFLSFLRRVLTNPMIVACLASLLMRHFEITLYAPVEKAVELVANASLGMGLILVGAGLRIRDTLRPRFLALLFTMVKLLVYPLVLATACMLFGLHGENLVILALCGGVPTAMNGYLLARQLGGDAPLYATITTLQTAGSFLTLPLIVYFATLVSTG